MATKCKHCDPATWYATVALRDEHISTAHPELDEDAALAAALGRREIESIVTIEGDEIDLFDAVMFLGGYENPADVMAQALGLYFETCRASELVMNACELRSAYIDARPDEETTEPEREPDPV